MHEVLGIIEESFGVAALAGDEAGEGTTNNREAQGDAECSELFASLGLEIPAVSCDSFTICDDAAICVQLDIDSWESLIKFSNVSEGSASASSRDGTDDSTKDSWHAVEVMNSTGIMKADLFLQPWAELKETKSGENSSDASDDH